MLISSTSLAILIPLTIVAVATPGADVLYVLANTSARKRTGIIAVLGIITGLLIHTLAVAVGVGELFAHSPFAFKLLKWMGALYLAYFAIHILFSKEKEDLADVQVKQHTLRSIYIKGFLTNALNPKAILYFLAVIPQFVDSTLGYVQLQLLLISFIDIMIAFLVLSSMSLMAHYFGQFLKSKQKASSPIWSFIKRYGLATLFGALAVKMALYS